MISLQPRRLSYSRHEIKDEDTNNVQPNNYKVHMQVRRMMSENKDLRNRNKVEGKPSGNSSRNDAHEVKYYYKIIVIYSIVRTLPNFWLIFWDKFLLPMFFDWTIKNSQKLQKTTILALWFWLFYNNANSTKSTFTAYYIKKTSLYMYTFISNYFWATWSSVNTEQ